MATTFEKVRRVLVQEFGVDEDSVLPDSSLIEDLNLDSADLVELAMSLEEDFSIPGERTIEIEDDDAVKIHTVQDIIDYLRDQDVEDE